MKRNAKFAIAILFLISAPISIEAHWQKIGSTGDFLDKKIKQLTNGQQDDRNARYSPDGRHIAFSSNKSGRSQIFIMPANGGEASSLTPTDHSALLPAWSPDGKYIAFESNKGGTNGIWYISIEGGEPFRITDHPDNEWNPRWSPDGQQLAFYTTWGNNMTDIWTVSAAGGDPRQITFDPAEDYQPTWSPDGEWLAFFSRRGRVTQIWCASRNGKISFPLTDETDNLWGGAPDWSPDGRTIIFGRSALEHLYIFSLEDGKETQLTKGQMSERSPVFAPSGKEILFVSTLFSAETELTVISSLHSEPYPLLPADQNNKMPKIQLSPVWSRSGKKIAFLQNSGGYLKTRNLWVSSAHGKDAKQLTGMGFVGNPVWCEGEKNIAFTGPGRISSDGNFNVSGGQIFKIGALGQPIQLTESPGNHVPTDYSPTLKQIIFHKAVDGVNKLFLLPVKGGNPKPLLTGTRSAEGARWSPDGKQIAFISNDDGQYDLYVMPALGGSARRLTNSVERESYPSWSADGKTLVYSMPGGHSTINSVEINVLGLKIQGELSNNC